MCDMRTVMGMATLGRVIKNDRTIHCPDVESISVEKEGWRCLTPLLRVPTRL